MRNIFGCILILAILLSACGTITNDSESSFVEPTDNPAEASASSEMEDHASEIKQVNHATISGAAKSTISGLSLDITCMRYEFREPDNLSIVDSYWLNNRMLILTMLPDTRTNSGWVFYTVNFSNGTVHLSTEEEIDDMHSDYFAGQRMNSLFVNANWGSGAIDYRHHPSAPSALVNSDATRSIRVDSQWDMEKEGGDPVRLIDIILIDEKGEETVIYQGEDHNLMEPAGCRPLGFLSDNITLVCQDDVEYEDVVSLLNTDTGEMTYYRFSNPYMAVQDFVPGLTDTIWVTYGSAPPGGFDQYRHNEIIDLSTGRQRSIDVFGAYREETGIAETHVTEYRMKLAKSSPVLICGFDDEAGSHLFLYNITDGGVTPIVTSEKEAAIGRWHPELSPDGKRLMIPVQKQGGYDLLLYEINGMQEVKLPTTEGL